MFAVDEPPELSGLWVSGIGLRDGGIFKVDAQAADTGFRMPARHYAAATVTSSAGERETIRIRREVCGIETGQAHYCQMFSFGLKPDADRDAFEVEVRRWRATLLYSSFAPGYLFGEGYAFDNWEKTTAALAALPGVEFIEVSGVFYVASGPPHPLSSLLAGVLPFRSQRPVRGDGVVSAQPGDTIVVGYLQPSGGTASTSFVLPPQG